ncbi:uncharacterized protein LOC141880476 [Acropora palmata]|uniref:uncharacterized protein LOC141880476 n=1 Tax=Acropora palmata TaxID=6131 RepID=UPI003DA0EB54
MVSVSNTPFAKGSDPDKHTAPLKVPVKAQRIFAERYICEMILDQKSSGVMLKEETGAFIVAVRRRENRRGCEIIKKILKVACILCYPCSWKISRPMFALETWTR